MEGPGVPEAIPRVVRGVGERLGPTALDRVWLFPPLVRGRREWGLVVASTYAAGRRVLHTARYEAERTGKGLALSWTLEEQGEAPPDRLPRVMTGVVLRSQDQLGDPREVEIDGSPERFDELLAEFDPALFEEEARALEQATS